MNTPSTSSTPSWNSLIFVISASNNRNDVCYVNKDFKLGIKAKPILEPASTRAVITHLLQDMQREFKANIGFYDNKQVKQLHIAFSEIETFIHSDKSLDKIEKIELCKEVQDAYTEYIERSRPIHLLRRLCREAQKTATICNTFAMAFFEVTLDTMAIERMFITDCINIHITLYLKSIVRKLFNDAGGAFVDYSNTGTSIFDWKRFPKLSAEEFSLCKALEEARLTDTRSIQKILKRILRESPHFEQFPAIKIIQLFLLSLDITTIMKYLEEESFTRELACWNEVQDRPYMFDETPSIIELTEHAFKNESMHVTVEQLQMVQNFAAIHRQKSDEMETLYGEILSAHSAQLSKVKYQSLLQKRIASLTGYKNIAVRQVKYKKFESAFLKDLPIHTANTLADDSPTRLFTAMHRYLCHSYGQVKPQSASPEASLDHSLEHSFSQISLKQKEEEQDEELLPTQVYRQICEKPPSIKTAPRVRDWQKKHPKILLRKPYDTLSQKQQEEAKLLHTFPITISHFLRAYSKPVTWRLEGRQHDDVLYKAPGTIECYAQDPVLYYEVEFQDCYDGQANILYHHFSKIRSFRKLLAETSVPLTPEEQAEIAVDYVEDEINDDEEISTFDERFHVKKNSLSILVDDTARRIRYTIGFPNRLSQLS